MNFALGTKENPIRCEGPSGERQYLDQITASKAKLDFTEHIQYRRIGSFPVAGKILDNYEIKNLKGDVVGHLFFDMYHEGYTESKVPPDFTRLDEEALLSSTGFMNLESMELKFDRRNRLREQYGESTISTSSHGYVESKAQGLLVGGPQFYALHDFFGYPQGDWELLELLKASDALVSKLAGLYAEEPLVFSSVKVLKQFFKTWHFDVLNADKASNKEALVVSAVHEVTGEDLSYWCIINKHA